MGDLSKNFSKWEFACHCGCGFDDIDQGLVDVLQVIRKHFRGPIKVKSGCRCKEHNRNVKGRKNSQHLLGLAADIVVRKRVEYENSLSTSIGIVHPTGVAQFATLIMYKITIPRRKYGGIGVYKTFIHLDVRDGLARWGLKWRKNNE